jgi:hypothetical protein
MAVYSAPRTAGKIVTVFDAVTYAAQADVTLPTYAPTFDTLSGGFPVVSAGIIDITNTAVTSFQSGDIATAAPGAGKLWIKSARVFQSGTKAGAVSMTILNYLARDDPKRS